MPKNNSVVVLSALLHGVPCKISGFIYLLDNDFRLCVQGFNESGEEEQDLLVVGSDLSSFVKICNDATDYEMSVIGMNLALNS